MRIITAKNISRLFVLLVVIFAATSCNVHEWPEPASEEPYILHLHYNTEMSIKEEPYPKSETLNITKNDNTEQIRYVIRAYPILQSGKPSHINYVREYIFYRDKKDGLDCSYLIDIPAGNFEILVWTDYVSEKGNYYDASDFSRIKLQNHVGNTDSRDAFRGKRKITVYPDEYMHAPNEQTVEMERPLAKFEIISNDLDEFILKQIHLSSLKSGKEVLESDINLDDYKVLVDYYMYMPNSYDMYEDKPSGVSTNGRFEGKIKKLSSTEASLGFDYVFVNGNEVDRAIKIYILDKDDEVIASTPVINVPVSRSVHTIIKGKFLTKKVSGGVTINPGYDDDYNIVYPPK